MTRKLKKGDIIGVSRLLGIYEHFGIYSGNGKVIHFTTPEQQDISGDNQIMETSIAKFMNGQNSFFLIDEKEWMKESKLWAYDTGIYSAKETINRAKSQLGQGDYRLWLNNCEHFAFWCKFGEKISLQGWGVGGRVELKYPDDVKVTKRKLVNRNKNYTFDPGIGYGVIHKYKRITIHGEEGFLVWDYGLYNELTFQSRAGKKTSLFTSFYDEETEEEFQEYINEYGK